MNTRTSVIVVSLLIVVALAASFALYASLPERLPTHWNFHGQVDDWGNKSWAAFMGAGFMAIFLLLLVAGQWLSPVNFKIEPFRDSYNYLMVIGAAMFAFIHALTLWAALNPDHYYGRWLVAGVFAFFACFGNLLGKTRRNFWVGIRTPWTIASERVWIATHRLAAWILAGVGVAGSIAVMLGAPMVPCFVLLVVGLAIPAVYSFWLSRNLEREPTT